MHTVSTVHMHLELPKPAKFQMTNLRITNKTDTRGHILWSSGIVLTILGKNWRKGYTKKQANRPHPIEIK